MKLISHRGNISGRNIHLENDPDYITCTMHSGYDVEIDVWYECDRLWLGHDEPEYKTTIGFLLSNADKLWIHCKNFEALNYLLEEESLRLFYHEYEDHTIMSNRLIWAHDINKANGRCIIPLLTKESIEQWIPIPVYGVCSDYIGVLND